MDSRVSLLREFYAELPMDRAKVETCRYGFGFLEAMLRDGMKLEYGELTLSGLLHKYKFTGIPARRMDELLQAHVDKTCNVCLYFGYPNSSLFCFNLDNNHKANNTELIPEVEITIKALRERLAALGCEPLVIASGRGYHAWGRLSEAVENDRLYDFMLRAAVQAMVSMHNRGGYDYRRIKFNFYPDPRARDIVSVRLFGSEHAKNKVFSRVLAAEGLLDEEASWKYFERHMASGTISQATFEEACRAISKETPHPSPSPRDRVSAGLSKWARSLRRPPEDG
jgi:hypothetical protein